MTHPKFRQEPGMPLLAADMADQLGVMPDALMTGRHLSISDCTNCFAAAGELRGSN